MSSYNFFTVPQITAEWEGSDRLVKWLRNVSSRRHLLFVTDGGILAAGLLDLARTSLAAQGFQITIFDGVVTNQPERVLLDCVGLARNAGGDLVIGLGGGSSPDVAKLTAVLLQSDQPLNEMYDVDRVRGARSPLALVPTTADTGSKVTNIAILTTGETAKMVVMAPQLYADAARRRRHGARDSPMLWQRRRCTCLPPTSCRPARTAAIARRVRRCCWARCSATTPRLRRPSMRSWQTSSSARRGPAGERAAAFIDFMRDLMRRTGAPRRLRDVGVRGASLTVMAADAMLQQRLLVNNSLPVDETQALALYREAF